MFKYFRHEHLNLINLISLFFCSRFSWGCPPQYFMLLSCWLLSWHLVLLRVSIVCILLYLYHSIFILCHYLLLPQNFPQQTLVFGLRWSYCRITGQLNYFVSLHCLVKSELQRTLRYRVLQGLHVPVWLWMSVLWRMLRRLRIEMHHKWDFFFSLIASNP